MVFRKKIKFRKDSDQGLGSHPMDVSAISTETAYMLHKTGAGVEGIEFQAVRVSSSPGTTGTYGEVGDGGGGPPQVMVRPTTHSPLPGGVTSLGMRSRDSDRPTSSEGSQVGKTWEFQTTGRTEGYLGTPQLESISAVVNNLRKSIDTGIFLYKPQGIFVSPQLVPLLGFLFLLCSSAASFPTCPASEVRPTGGGSRCAAWRPIHLRHRPTAPSTARSTKCPGKARKAGKRCWSG